MIAWWWNQTSKNKTEEAEPEMAEPGGKMKAGPRRTKAKKMFSTNRFANLIRRNSISLKTKGTWVRKSSQGWMDNPFRPGWIPNL